MGVPRQLDGGNTAVAQFGQGSECKREIDGAFAKRQVLVGMRAHVVQLHVGQQRTGLQEGPPHAGRLHHHTVADVHGHPQVVRIAECCPKTQHIGDRLDQHSGFRFDGEKHSLAAGILNDVSDPGR